MKTLRTVLVTLLVLMLLAAGFVWSGLYNIGADDEHTGVIYTLLETLRDRSIAARARERAQQGNARRSRSRAGK